MKPNPCPLEEWRCRSGRVEQEERGTGLYADFCTLTSWSVYDPFCESVSMNVSLFLLKGVLLPKRVD
jgi:hypothetical protein